MPVSGCVDENDDARPLPEVRCRHTERMAQSSVLMVSPFDRGLASGGSQRATAIAEALEDRGACVRWWTTETTLLTVGRRLMRSIAGPPEATLCHPTSPMPVGLMKSTGPDIVMSCHSYLGEAAIASGARSCVDFQNIESDHMRDLANLTKGAKRLYWRRQATLMRKLEVSVAQRADVVSVSTAAAAEWLVSHADVQALSLPNVLPRAEADRSRAVAALRQPDLSAPRLLFVGTLDYLPNVVSLDRFLKQTWPAIRQALPAIRLDVVGRCARESAARWAAFDGVDVRGFVADLTPILSSCTAAVLPLVMSAGSSLRALTLGLAEVPMIGTADAFRGFEDIGLAATGVDSWVTAVHNIVAGGSSAASTIAHARRVADRIQSDATPFDALWAALIQ